MTFNSIYELITYFKRHYGVYQIRIEERNVKSQLYYFWEVIPEDILSASPKEFNMRFVKDQYELNHRELSIIY